MLQFDIAGSLGPLERLLCLLAVERLESLKTGDVKIFVEKYLATLRPEHAGHLDSLRENKLIPCGESEVWQQLASQVAAAITAPRRSLSQ